MKQTILCAGYKTIYSRITPAVEGIIDHSAEFKTPTADVQFCEFERPA
jgi:hypothetical protein